MPSNFGYEYTVWVNFGLSFNDHRRHRFHLNPQQWVGDVGCRPRLPTDLPKAIAELAKLFCHTHIQIDTDTGTEIQIQIQKWLPTP